MDAISTDLPLIIELLVARRLLDSKGVDTAFREQTKRGCSLEEALLHARLVTEVQIARAYSEQLLLPLVMTSDAIDVADPNLKEYLPEKFARENHLLPLSHKGGVLNAAFADPTDLALVQETQLHAGMNIRVHVGTLSAIDQGLDLIYGSQEEQQKEATAEAAEPEVDIAKAAEEEVLDLDRMIAETRETRIIRIVNTFLSQAIRDKASDIHLEPYPNEVKLRFRIDGVLNEMRAPAPHLYVPIISRLKILCKMDIAEKRVPQDGAFSIKVGEVRIDVRVSTIPTVHGEKMVLRILNKEAVPLDLAALGFDEKQREDFMVAAHQPHGLLFVTGPTGSGKSTTLYATLNLLRSPKKNILTVEDPVEYKFAGINQVQVKPQVDLTFSRTLRAFLRQDPDIIMVGEVRDPETAQICLRAALTGHLVLSTLHTNDALSTISRLTDMGIEPFLIASTLRLLEAQRLVRKLCPECREPFHPDQETADKYQLSRDLTLYRAKGCRACRDVGYRGRMGLFEVVRITPALRDLIQDRAPLPKLNEAARRENMQALFDNGLDKVKAGLTSLDEVVSLVSEGG